MGGAVVAEQSCRVGVADQDDVSAIAAVTAIRTREWFELFTFDGNAAVAPAPRAEMQCDSIDEGSHNEFPSNCGKRAEPEPAGH